MKGFKFDPEHLEHLNDPQRLEDIPPQWIWDKLEMDHHPATVVDLGAGTGFFSRQFVNMPGVGQLYALDISEAMVDYMNREVVPKDARITPMQMEEAAIPLEDDTADVLIMINLHHEFHHPLEVLKECSRVLKPEGRLSIVDWKKEDTGHGPPVDKRYRVEEVEEQIQSAPFHGIHSYIDMPVHFLIVARNAKGSGV